MTPLPTMQSKMGKAEIQKFEYHEKENGFLD